jgi:hypothetical protein
MKKWNSRLNAAMISAVTIFVTRTILDFIDYKVFRPDMYLVRSTPWYTASLLYGVITLAIVLVCLIIKAILKHRNGSGGPNDENR